MSDRDNLEQSHKELLRWTDFGRWLEAKRLERGLTRTRVAAESHMGVQTLVALEHGGYRRTADGPWITPNPRDETLISLARVLGLDAREMFAVVGRYDERSRTVASLRRASGRQASRERLEELERRVAEVEAQLRELAADREARQARRRRA
jgi:transcriptional regulator with XRE-family HTH domain